MNVPQALSARTARFLGRTTIAAFILSGALFAPTAAPADPADFYKGKTVEILVGFSPGGGYDAYARALSRSIGNHIPGKPAGPGQEFRRRRQPPPRALSR